MPALQLQVYKNLDEVNKSELDSSVLKTNLSLVDITSNPLNDNFNQPEIATICEQSLAHFEKLPKLFSSVCQNNILIPQQFIVEGEPQELSSLIDSVTSLFPSSSNFSDDSNTEHSISLSSNNNIITTSAVSIRRLANPNYLLDVTANKDSNESKTTIEPTITSENLLTRNVLNSTTPISSIASLNLSLTSNNQTSNSPELFNKSNLSNNVENSKSSRLANLSDFKTFKCGFKKDTPTSIWDSNLKNNKDLTSSSVIQLYNALQLNQSNKYDQTIFSTTYSSLYSAIQSHSNFDSPSNQENHIENESYSVEQKFLTTPSKSKSLKVIKLLSSSVEKRNARERTRVHTVNQAFHLLKNNLPSICGNTKRVSKLKILKAAVNYICSLNNLLSLAVNFY